MEKLSLDDVEEIDNAHPMEWFRRGIKTDGTFKTYDSALRSVLCTALGDILHGTYKERAAEFVEIGKKDPVKVRNIITQLVKAWSKQAKLDPSDSKYMSPRSIRTILSPIKKLLDMNDVVLVWKKIYEMCPEGSHNSPKPGWTSEDIRMMLDATASRLMRAAILMLASSGMRRGGLELKWGDIDPVYLKDGKPVASEDAPEMRGTAEPACAKIHVYRRDSEEYITYMTPEAYNALMEYKAEWEEDVGRAPGPEDPVFKKRGSEPTLLECNMIAKRLRQIVKKSGVRKPSDKKGKSCQVPLTNGFRRKFNKDVTDTPTDGSVGASRRKEYMLGHYGSVGLDRVYYYAHPMELAADYLRAVQALTVTKEGRLLIEHERMTKETQRVMRELEALKRREMARAGAAEPQSTSKETADTNEAIERLAMTVKNLQANLNSLIDGR